jgi:hypothetical protein
VLRAQLAQYRRAGVAFEHAWREALRSLPWAELSVPDRCGWVRRRPTFEPQSCRNRAS